jgi:hypothetical protein
LVDDDDADEDDEDEPVRRSEGSIVPSKISTPTATSISVGRRA